MKASFAAIVALLGAAAAQSASPQSTSVPAPLFSGNAEIELTLRLPLRTLLRHPMDRPDVEGTVLVSGRDAALQSLDVDVTPRGHSRLEICAFPPLRLNFRRRQVADSLFAGQNRLKLVTQCRVGEDYAGYLELEYFVYRLYEQISDAAFRVRPTRMRYVDTDRDDEARTAPAFFIEPIGGVAERLGSRAVSVPRLAIEQLEPRALTRLAVFQFVIGNTDWAVTEPSLGEDTCCHNGEVLALPGNEGSFVIVPFDFDHAGIVGAEYAKPDERLGIRSVRERLYRGYCATNEHLAETIAQFNAARPAIDALLEERHLAPEVRAAAASYLSRSYEVLNDERERQRQVVERCLRARR